MMNSIERADSRITPSTIQLPAIIPYSPITFGLANANQETIADINHNYRTLVFF